MQTLMTEMMEPGVLQVRLNRPKQLNALDATMVGELGQLFRELNNNRDVRAVIMTGEGRGFCAGADLTSRGGPGMIPGTEGMGQVGFIYKFQEYLADTILAIHECDKPVIAAVNGVAVGGGLALTLASDIRVASRAGKFGSVFIKTGLSSCDVGTSYFLPRLVGPSAAAELMLTGRIIDAEEALNLRLVSRVVPDEELLPVALDIARQIVANAEYGVWMTKKGLRANLDAPSLRHAMELENRQQVLGCFTGCMDEMMAAFTEGRAPVFPRL